MTIQVGEVGRKRERVQYVPVFRVQLVREGSTKTRNKELSSPSAAADIMQDYIGDTDREIFVVAMLDTKNKVIGINTVAVGSLNSTIVHPREVLKPAILVNAAGIIVGHNHPSGDPTPSLEDMSVTERLGSLQDRGINLLDHVIIGNGQYLSFKERGFCKNNIKIRRKKMVMEYTIMNTCKTLKSVWRRPRQRKVRRPGWRCCFS